MEEIILTDYIAGFRVTAVSSPRSMVATASRSDRVVVFYGELNGCDLAEARAFAQRIIAVADAVEQELAKGEK